MNWKIIQMVHGLKHALFMGQNPIKLHAMLWACVQLCISVRSCFHSTYPVRRKKWEGKPILKSIYRQQSYTNSTTCALSFFSYRSKHFVFLYKKQNTLSLFYVYKLPSKYQWFQLLSETESLTSSPSQRFNHLICTSDWTLIIH